MAQEELMHQLPRGITKPSETGPFFIRNNSDGDGPYSIVVLTNILVTCGGEGGKARADEFASRFNRVWNQWFDEK